MVFDRWLVSKMQKFDNAPHQHKFNVLPENKRVNIITMKAIDKRPFLLVLGGRLMDLTDHLKPGNSLLHIGMPSSK